MDAGVAPAEEPPALQTAEAGISDNTMEDAPAMKTNRDAETLPVKDEPKGDSRVGSRPRNTLGADT